MAKPKTDQAVETMGMRLKALLRARDISQGALSRALGVTGAAVSQWINDQSEPTPVNLILLADYFGVSVTFLVLGRARRLPGDRVPPYLQSTGGKLLTANAD